MIKLYMGIGDWGLGIGDWGLLLGLLDEKIYNGSIIPSAFLHGLGNFISNLSVIF